ncbi:condensation domain-containing protein, partial [Gilvimarinus sp. SDUM040013]
MGRLDHQVKIRGFRIELGEIENALVDFPSIDNAVVVSVGDDQHKRLVAYVVLGEQDRNVLDASGSANSERDEILSGIQEGLLKRLPDYMVPSQYMILSELPLSSNGKIDRKSLPDVDVDVMKGEYRAPSNEIEKMLCDIWQEVLGLDKVGVNDNFFAIGGHSLLIVQIVSGIARAGKRIRPLDIYENPTVSQLAEKIHLVREDKDCFISPVNLIEESLVGLTPDVISLVALSQSDVDELKSQLICEESNIQDVYPLGPLQEGMLYHNLLLGRESDPYILSTLFRVASEKVLNDILAAIELVVRKHDSLRTGFYYQGISQPIQVVFKNVPSPVTWHTLEGSELVRDEDEFWEKRRAKMELSRPPLLRLDIAKRARSQDFLVLVTLHHLVTDVTSESIIRSDIIRAITEGVQKVESKPAPGYREYIAYNQFLSNEQLAKDYFTKKLKFIDSPINAFGLVRSDAEKLTKNISKVSKGCGKNILKLCQKYNVSPAIIFHAAWAIVVSRASVGDDAVFGTVMSGRMQGLVSAESTVGLFINTLPVCISLGGLRTDELIGQMEENLKELIPFENTSLVEAQKCSSVTNDTPLFNSIINYRHAKEEKDNFANEKSITMLKSEERTSFPLTLNVDDLSDNVYRLDVQVAGEVNAERVSEYMQQALQRLVGDLLDGGKTPVAELS